MKNLFKQSDLIKEQQPISEQEKRAQLILHYIETRIIKSNKSLPVEEEKEIEAYYKEISDREKTDVLYSKIMAYMADKQIASARKKEVKKGVEEKEEIFEPVESDPYLISEIKILSRDSEVKQLLPATYGDARIDVKKFRLSELGNLWNNLCQEIQQKDEKYKKLEKDLHLNKISGRERVSSAKSQMALLAKNLTAIEQLKKNIETLKGFPKTVENTDIAAQLQYKQLKEYKKQLDGPGKFVWLPSRKIIHQETINAILNHRWPDLIGEAGTGKSQQANVAAIELTGYLPTKLKCESVTGEKQMIEDIAIDPETGGSYKEYGPLMQAYTGYEDSRQKEPTISTGRITRFDESGRLGLKAYSIIKEVRQLSSGEELNGKPVLPGASAIWTSNPVGPRYPDRHSPDPAMRREIAEIYIDYPEMSVENPELYKFALIALFDENNFINIAKQELSPAYERKDIPEDRREILDDNSIIVAKNEIISDISDNRHGALWRFCGAIKSLQDSFIYGNSQAEKYPDTLLRFKEDADDNITIDDSGKVLTLSSSTVTLGELSSWMSGFNERRQKQATEFRVDTFTEWLNFKINTYIKQADKADKEKLRALFRYFGFLDKATIPDLANAKPLTPKEIGYLPPDVPRPVFVEKPITTEKPETETLLPKEKEKVKKNETRQVILEDGSRTLMEICEFTLENGIYNSETEELAPRKIAENTRFNVDNKSYIFAGVVEDEKNQYHGQPIGQFVDEKDLYKIFSQEELRLGIISEFKNLIGETGVDDEKENILDYWKIEGCESTHGELAF